MTLRVVLVAVLVATAAACSSSGKPTVGTATTGPIPTSSAQTEIAVYAPWGSGGKLTGVTATKTQEGNCFAGSIAASGRADAWRCSVGDEIMDPCFADPGGHQVACPAFPDLTSVATIHLGRSLDPGLANHDNPAAAPWMLQIAGPVSCAFLTGATNVVAGHRLNYACSDGSSLFGTPDRTSAQWTILRGTSASPEQTPVPIAKAWN
jgi:hypothetical protein